MIEAAAYSFQMCFYRWFHNPPDDGKVATSHVGGHPHPPTTPLLHALCENLYDFSYRKDGTEAE
jgi:hypothetical protein